MATIATIRAGIKTRLETISGLTVTAVMPGQLTAPHASVELERVVYDQAQNGQAEYTVSVTIWAAPAQQDHQTGQETLDAYVSRSGANSVYAALVGDATLNAAADTIGNIEMTDYGIARVADVDYWTARWQVLIWD